VTRKTGAAHVPALRIRRAATRRGGDGRPHEVPRAGREGTRPEDGHDAQAARVAHRALPDVHARQAAQEDGHGLRRELSRTAEATSRCAIRRNTRVGVGKGSRPARWALGGPSPPRNACAWSRRGSWPGRGPREERTARK
jgi:hypothetical protein